MLILGDEAAWARAQVVARGHTVVRRDPALVLCHGGDGTLLRAERWYPGVPKVPARVGRHADLCDQHRLPAVLERFEQGLLEREDLALLRLSVGRASFEALNDVVLRNDNPAVAVRLRLSVDGGEALEVTGDGLVVATPFGSTGYFRSVSGTALEEGLGVAFNNSVRGEGPLRLPSGARLDVEVIRGPAVLVCDNDARTILLREGHRLELTTASRRAVVHGLDALRCQRCRRSDGRPFHPH